MQRVQFPSSDLLLKCFRKSFKNTFIRFINEAAELLFVKLRQVRSAFPTAFLKVRTNLQPVSSNNCLDYRGLLSQELTHRLKKNSKYSQRAFARDLRISPSFLTLLLSKKRTISEGKAYEFCEALRWNSERSRVFVQLVRMERIKSVKGREEILKELEGSETYHLHRLEDDIFKLVSEWYCFALVELVSMSGGVYSELELARRLGIPKKKIIDAVERLIRVGLLTRESSQLRKAQKFYTTSEIPSEAIRNFHQQMLDKASQALVTQPFDERDFSGASFSFDPKLMKDVKELIRKFRRDLMKFADSRGTPGGVFHLAIQFFRLDRP